MADELSHKREISLPRVYGSSSRAMFLMRLLRRLPSKFSYLRIKDCLTLILIVDAKERSTH